MLSTTVWYRVNADVTFYYGAEWNARNYIICFIANGSQRHSRRSMWRFHQPPDADGMTFFFRCVQKFPVRSDSSASPLYETELAQVRERVHAVRP